MSVTTAGQRLIFANAVALMQAEGVSADWTKLTQSYLRLEFLANTTSTSYSFNPVQGQGTNVGYNTEQKLTLQDTFVVSEAAIFWFIPGGSTLSNSPLLSWPNPNIFTTANAATSAETLYNSYIQLAVNKTIIVPFWDIYRSRCVNQTQLTAAANSPVDQLSGRDDVFYPTEPFWLLIGSRNNIFTIQMPNAFAAVQANSRIVLYFRGPLAQNCTSVQ